MVEIVEFKLNGQWVRSNKERFPRPKDIDVIKSIVVKEPNV